MSQVKIPRSYRARLKEVGRKHDFKGWQDFGEHLLVRGLEQLAKGGAGSDMASAMAEVAEERGYSSVDEVVEHLLERGLAAYDDSGLDRASFEERLRGLGYID
jgi:hypothetical protein